MFIKVNDKYGKVVRINTYNILYYTAIGNGTEIKLRDKSFVFAKESVDEIDKMVRLVSLNK